MGRRARFVASAFGSAGDFLPTLAVARGLRNAGHEVTFVTNPFHADVIRRADAGMGLVTVGDHVDLYKLITDDPGLLTSPRVLGVMVEDLARPHYVATYHAVRALLRSERVDGVIGSNLAFGALWAALEREVPAMMLAATPLAWTSRAAPVQFLDVELPSWALSLAIGLTNGIGFGLVDHALRSIARSAGATAFDTSYSAVTSRVALHVGVWPELLRPRAPDDQPNMRACGFIRAGHLGAAAPELPRALEAFLDAGEPPIVIALGSIFSLSEDALIADAAAASARLGHRVVVVGPAPRGHTLPEGAFVVPYAAYHLLFPRARATIIHGGAGTTAEALRSGRPTVVVPFAFDQFGIAWQVERLGAGVRVRKRDRTIDAIERALERALDPEISGGAARVGAALADARDGALVCAEWAGELALEG
ncbi:MAG: glycosyltransferase [Polyangiaceae bacterium]